MLSIDGNSKHYQFGMQPHLFDKIKEEKELYNTQLEALQTQRPEHLAAAKQIKEKGRFSTVGASQKTSSPNKASIFQPI